MSDSNVDTYKRILEAFNERGLAGALEYFSEDIEVYDPDLPQGMRIRGHERCPPHDRRGAESVRARP